MLPPSVFNARTDRPPEPCNKYLQPKRIHSASHRPFPHPVIRSINRAQLTHADMRDKRIKAPPCILANNPSVLPHVAYHARLTRLRSFRCLSRDSNPPRCPRQGPHHHPVYSAVQLHWRVHASGNGPHPGTVIHVRLWQRQWLQLRERTKRGSHHLRHRRYKRGCGLYDQRKFFPCNAGSIPETLNVSYVHRLVSAARQRTVGRAILNIEHTTYP